jgi:hypothetical protein
VNRNAFGVTLSAPSTGHEIQNSLTFMLDQGHPERNLLVYPVGRQLGIRDLKSNTMKFFKSPDQDFIEVTAIGYSKSKKNVAVAYNKQGDKRAYIDFH